MNEKIKDYVKITIKNMLDKVSGTPKIKKLQKKHDEKIHFIPIKYRVFSGLLQSLNIQFGNFIEELMTTIIKSDGKYEIIKEYSGKKSNSFTLSKETEELIDKYMTTRQTENINESTLESKFEDLLKKIIHNENNSDLELISFKHDVDILFRDIKTKIIYYVEIKYNDDHDTGKFTDINRKFIKTYAYLVKELKIKDITEFQPILFYFTNKKMKGNIYLPETKSIYRGKRFFDKFLSIKYDDLDEYMKNLSEDKDTILMFDELYKKITK